MAISLKKRKPESQVPDVQLDGATTATEPSQAELSRVVYVGHLPHGFYEKELLGFFSQFGKVTRVRVSRNKHTAKARGYAFIEFQHQEVAKIAAETMDGYFMFAQKLQCHLLKKDDVHPQLFKGANRVFKKIPWHKIESDRLAKERTPEQHAKRISKALARDKKRQQKIKQAGIDFEYEPLSAATAVQTEQVPVPTIGSKSVKGKASSYKADTPVSSKAGNAVAQHASVKKQGEEPGPHVSASSSKSASKKPLINGPAVATPAGNLVGLPSSLARSCRLFAVEAAAHPLKSAKAAKSSTPTGKVASTPASTPVATASAKAVSTPAPAKAPKHGLASYPASAPAKTAGNRKPEVVPATTATPKAKKTKL